MLADLTILAQSKGPLEEHLTEVKQAMSQLTTPEAFLVLEQMSTALECALEQLTNYEEMNHGLQFDQSEYRCRFRGENRGNGKLFADNGPEQCSRLSRVSTANERVVSDDLSTKHHHQNRTRCDSGNRSKDVAKYLMNTAIYLAEQGKSGYTYTVLSPLLNQDNEDEISSNQICTARIIYAISLGINGYFDKARKYLESDFTYAADFFREFITLLELNKQKAEEKNGTNIQSIERLIKNTEVQLVIKADLIQQFIEITPNKG